MISDTHKTIYKHKKKVNKQRKQNNYDKLSWCIEITLNQIKFRYTVIKSL